MKYLLLSGLISLGTVLNAQVCTRTGSFQGTDVSVSGTGELKQDGNAITVELGSDFMSDAGPDLDVYLSEESHPLATGIKLEALNSLSGAQSYSVPNGVLITDFDYVVIHCTQYNHLYGYALLSAPTGNCSVALGTDDKRLEGLKVIQEGGRLRIQSDLQFTNPVFQIHDLSGREIFKTNSITDFAELTTKGIYVVSVSTVEGSFQEKVFVK